MNFAPDQRSFLERVADSVFNVPVWLIIAVAAIPVVTLVFREHRNARVLILLGITMFLIGIAFCYVMPWSSRDIIKSKQAWDANPAFAGLVAFIVVAIAPIVFVSAVMFLTRRAKEWLTPKD